VYENDATVAILDISPKTLGHTLVIPKEHHVDLFDLPDDIAKEVAVAIKKIAAAVKKATNATGINVLQNNGESAGQYVFHSHSHIVPRVEGDGIYPLKGGRAEQSKEATAEIKEKIKNLL